MKKFQNLYLIILLHHVLRKKIKSNDNVAIALESLKRGMECEQEGRIVHLLDDIPAAHKVALCNMGECDPVVKYGLPIGHTTTAVRAGEHVHIHNVTTNLNGLLEYRYEPGRDVWGDFRGTEEAWFDGYPREDGKAGHRRNSKPAFSAPRWRSPCGPRRRGSTP